MKETSLALMKIQDNSEGCDQEWQQELLVKVILNFSLFNFIERICSKEIGFVFEEIVIEESKDDSGGSDTMFRIQR